MKLSADLLDALAHRSEAKDALAKLRAPDTRTAELRARAEDLSAAIREAANVQQAEDLGAELAGVRARLASMRQPTDSDLDAARQEIRRAVSAVEQAARKQHRDATAKQWVEAEKRLAALCEVLGEIGDQRLELSRETGAVVADARLADTRQALGALFTAVGLKAPRFGPGLGKAETRSAEEEHERMRAASAQRKAHEAEESRMADRKRDARGVVADLTRAEGFARGRVETWKEHVDKLRGQERHLGKSPELDARIRRALEMINQCRDEISRLAEARKEWDSLAEQQAKERQTRAKADAAAHEKRRREVGVG